MKQLSLILIALLIINVTIPSFALSADKLLKLDSLPSQRLKKMAQDYNESKIWPALAWGLLGVTSIMADNQATLNSIRISYISYGYFCLLYGGITYARQSEYEIGYKTLGAMKLTALDKEVAAYALIKSGAEKGQQERKSAGLLAFLFSLGFAALANSSPAVAQSQKDTANIGAAAILGIGLFAYFMPSDYEKALSQMDKELKELK